MHERIAVPFVQRDTICTRTGPPWRYRRHKLALRYGPYASWGYWTRLSTHELERWAGKPADALRILRYMSQDDRRHRPAAIAEMLGINESSARVALQSLRAVGLCSLSRLGPRRTLYVVNDSGRRMANGTESELKDLFDFARGKGK